MIIRKTQTTSIDRPFPDENTVAEMYCNEASIVDNEYVEDWTSSLQMLLTFAAIFSAVLVTLIVDSKMLLKQDNNDVLVDAVVFLMNDLANGTHRPYIPPKFQPSALSVLVNCFFFASLCLSIATALGAVLAMQWVTDYGAVTGRTGSTPEERMKRRHFRYQGGQDWRMDTIIGVLPIALHLSVLLFFVGLVVWMWDVHKSIFGVIVVCGALAILFYVATTTLAIFCPSCPYRTPLSSWLYVLFHLFIAIFSRFPWFKKLETWSEEAGTESESEAETQNPSRWWLIMVDLCSRFSRPSLSSRDDLYIRSSDKVLTQSAFIWLSNHISISPEVYRRLLLLIEGFSSVVGSSPTPPLAKDMVPWRDIFHVLGVVYQSFVQNLDLDEGAFTELIRQTHCLSQPGLGEVLESLSYSKSAHFDEDEFPIQLLYAWTKSVSSHSSDDLRKQRFSDEVAIQDMVRRLYLTPQRLLDTWFSLLFDEPTTCQRIPSQVLNTLGYGTEGMPQKLHIVFYIISTGCLPWGTTVPVYRTIPGHLTLVRTTPVIRRLRVLDWVNGLVKHPQRRNIIRSLCQIGLRNHQIVLQTSNDLTEETEAELRKRGVIYSSRLTRLEEQLYDALIAFDQILAAEDQHGSMPKHDMARWMMEILCKDLMHPDVSLNPRYFDGDSQTPQAQKLRAISNPLLRFLACLLGIEWPPLPLSQHLSVTSTLRETSIQERLSQVLLRDPPVICGNNTVLWSLRLQQWPHFSPNVSVTFLSGTLSDLNKLKRIEQELSDAKIGIEHGGDFLIALIYLNYAYTWDSSSESTAERISAIVVGGTWCGHMVSKDCFEYLSLICREVSDDPIRLIRLLTELIRADINHSFKHRKLQIFVDLLKHAKRCLSSKDLGPFSPSCRRLIRYIKASYDQSLRDWDKTLDFYAMSQVQPSAVYRNGDFHKVYEEVTALLQPTEPCDGEVRDIAWSRHLLRPTGTRYIPFREDEEPMTRERQVEWGYDIANEAKENSGLQSGPTPPEVEYVRGREINKVGQFRPKRRISVSYTSPIIQ